jgi:hypothetical protein
VAENLADRLDGHARIQRQRGEGVTQVVDPNAGHASGQVEAVVLGRKVHGVQGRAVPRCNDQAALLPGEAGERRVSWAARCARRAARAWAGR